MIEKYELQEDKKSKLTDIIDTIENLCDTKMKDIIRIELLMKEAKNDEEITIQQRKNMFMKQIDSFVSKFEKN